MPSPFGHTLAGLAIAWTGGRPRARVWALALSCAVLAALPDADLLIPGTHRTFTHSVLAAVLVTIIAVGVTGKVTGKVDWRAGLLCGGAYASHLLMDVFGADPNPPSGIQLFWPARIWIISPWTFFPGTERRHLLTCESFKVNLKALVVEAAVMTPIAAAAWFMRRYRNRVRSSGQDSPPPPSD